MTCLPFSALKGGAAGTAQGLEAAAQDLLQELRRVRDHAARERLQNGQKSARHTSFQINVRQPLRELTPRQASRYLDRISMALPAAYGTSGLGDLGPREAQELADTLDAIAKRLLEP